MNALERRELHARYLKDTEWFARQYVRYINEEIDKLPLHRTVALITVTPPHIMFPKIKEYPAFADLFGMVTAILGNEQRYSVEWKESDPLIFFIQWAKRYTPPVVDKVEIPDTVKPSIGIKAEKKVENVTETNTKTSSISGMDFSNFKFGGGTSSDNGGSDLLRKVREKLGK